MTTLNCDYESLVNEVAWHLFGLRPTATDVITDSVASANQETDILRAIAKGLQYVYSAHRWSFLRPLVDLVTYPDYTTGTITVDASGNVAGTDTVFPAYSASANGWLTIPSVGSYAVGTYTSGTVLVLTDYNGGAVTSASTYTLWFNRYPLPTGVDSLEGRLTFPAGTEHPSDPLNKVPAVDIRRLLSASVTPGRPRIYAETTETFDATAGSDRFVTLWPPPDEEYTLTAVGTLQPPMITSTDKYPLGVEVLAPCIAESCLAAAERDVQCKDASHPDAVHNRALMPLLAMAIQQDREKSSAETLGVDRGQESGQCRGLGPERFSSGRIYWDAGCYHTGYL
jgi:hypothetical protein